MFVKKLLTDGYVYVGLCDNIRNCCFSKHLATTLSSHANSKNAIVVGSYSSINSH